MLCKSKVFIEVLMIKKCFCLTGEKCINVKKKL